jgi:hypothetical protein
LLDQARRVDEARRWRKEARLRREEERRLAEQERRQEARHTSRGRRGSFASGRRRSCGLLRRSGGWLRIPTRPGKGPVVTVAGAPMRSSHNGASPLGEVVNTHSDEAHMN